MAKYYLSRVDGTYSDAGDYAAKPADRPDGTWVSGTPSGGSDMYTPSTSEFTALSVADRDEFYNALSKGLAAIGQGDTEYAAHICDLITADPADTERVAALNKLKSLLGVS